MRKTCALFLALFSILIIYSCQKSIGPGQLPLPNLPDSALLVKSVVSVNYDPNDVILWRTTEIYDYDTLLNRTVVTFNDSNAIGNGQLRDYKETFQYDNNNRLFQYSTTEPGAYTPRVDFIYDVTGNITKATVGDKLVGSIEYSFKTTSLGTGKTISMYDTSGKVFDPNDGQRPSITHLTFDSDNRLTEELTYTTIHNTKERQYWFDDTANTKIFYDATGNISKSTYQYNAPDYVYPRRYKDSSIYSYEGTDKTLFNSFLAVYRNLYWFVISDVNYSFARSMFHTSYLSYMGSPVKNIAYRTYYPPSTTVVDQDQGTVMNIFNSQGQLTNAVYPKNFGNKYGGKTVIAYTYAYVKVKKK